MADPVSLLLHLQRRARDAANAVELGFVMVNETHALTPYRQAALWEAGRGIEAVSGVAVADDGAPFTLALARICQHLAKALPSGGAVDPALLSEADRAEWVQWLPVRALWLPIKQGGLLFARDQEWSELETAMLNELAHAYGHALASLRRPSPWAEWRARIKTRRRPVIIAAAALITLAIIPVPLTVLASAEVVAAHPAVIRAPLEGVVDRISIHPNEHVTQGQALFSLDDTTLTGKIEVAEKSLATAEAELRQYTQQAVFDPTAKPKLAVAAGHRDEQAAELRSLQSQLERIRVKAPTSGIVVLGDPSEWIGRPVEVGEKVMELAGETDTEIEAWLAPGDAIELKPGTALTLFLNVQPLDPVDATVTTVAYQASPRPDGTVAHRVRARISDGQSSPRLGLKGTARLSGHRVALVYWLLRRPIAAARAWAGL